MDSVADDRVLLCRVSPFGNLRIEAYVPLPEAYRSLSRPSSAPDAKAFPLRSFSLNLRRCGLRSFRVPARPCGHARKLHITSSHLLSEPKRSLCFGFSWFSNYAGSFRILLHEIVCPFGSTIASEFPSVALLVFPLFSFQCAGRRCKLRIVRSGASARAHSLRCISSSSRTFVRSDGDGGYDVYPLN